MLTALLPYRYWRRLPVSIPTQSAAFLSGIATLMLGAAIGIPGFLAHAHQTASLGIDAALKDMYRTEIYRGDLVIGFSGLSLFTFLLLTPLGWLTLYLIGSGSIRAAAAWFDDPIGDPTLTILDYWLIGGRDRLRTARDQRARERLEGPEVPDRVVSAERAGVAACDFVIVSSRRKPGWEQGVAVFTQDGAYRIGEVVERTIAGRLRTLYPLTTHADFEAIRKSVHYDLPAARGRPE